MMRDLDILKGFVPTFLHNLGKTGLLMKPEDPRYKDYIKMRPAPGVWAN